MMMQYRLLAGTAKRDITNLNPATPVMDRLFAKVLVLQYEDRLYAIVSMDVTAIGGRKISDYILNDVGEEFLPRLRSLAASELGIDAKNILVNASHTHPPGQLLCDDAQQVKLVFEALQEACTKLEPVKIGAGKCIEESISMNRTVLLKNNRHWSIRHSHPSPPAQEIQSYGHIDPEITVLRVDRLDGSPLAIVYNFALHLLFGDPSGRITANIPAYSSSLIEQELGHNCMALFIQGAAGDVIDIGFKNFEQERDIVSIGRKLGWSVLSALDSIKTGSAAIRVHSETVRMPFRRDIPERLAELELEKDHLLASLMGTALNFESFMTLYKQELKLSSEMKEFNRKQVDKYLSNIRAMEKLTVVMDKIETLNKHQRIIHSYNQDDIEFEIQIFKISNAFIVACPAELLAEVGLNIKNISPLPNTLIAAYSNGYVHYGAPAAYYAKGGYEVTECLLAPEWQEIFETKCKNLFDSKIMECAIVEPLNKIHAFKEEQKSARAEMSRKM